MNEFWIKRKNFDNHILAIKYFNFLHDKINSFSFVEKAGYELIDYADWRIKGTIYKISLYRTNIVTLSISKKARFGFNYCSFEEMFNNVGDEIKVEIAYNLDFFLEE